jgi:hypothetical protein
MARGAVSKHQKLQRAAFRWALGQGFGVAAMDVPLSSLGGRLDVVACRFEPVRRARGVNVLKSASVMVVECKADRDDFLRDARSEEELRKTLGDLQRRRSEWDASLRKEFPTLREGATLFPEFDVYRFQEVAGREYGELVGEIGRLSDQLYARSKFSKLQRWPGANLHYVAALEGVARPEELPQGWGLLEWHSGEMEVAVKAFWQDAPDANRWLVSMKTAACATEALAGRLREEEDLFGV